MASINILGVRYDPRLIVQYSRSCPRCRSYSEGYFYFCDVGEPIKQNICRQAWCELCIMYFDIEISPMNTKEIFDKISTMELEEAIIKLDQSRNATSEYIL